MKPKSLDPYLMEALESELMAGERLLWAGQPNPMRLAQTHLGRSAGGIIFFVFTLMMFGFIFGNFNMMDFGGMGGFSSSFGLVSSIFSLVLFIFLATSLWGILTPVFDYWKATRTIYGITNRRVIVREQGFSATVKSYSAEDIERIERREKADGSGDIIIDEETRLRSYRNSSGYNRTRAYTVPVGLFGVRNVREVEALMLETFRPHESSSPDRDSLWDDIEAKQKRRSDSE